MATPRQAERGVALVAVLWVLAIVSVMALSLATDSRNALRAASGAVALARARAIAEAGVSMALLDVLRADPAAPWPADGRVHRLSFDGAVIDVAVRDEGGKVDLNNAAPPLLRAMLRAAGINGPRADDILAQIIDWRTPRRGAALTPYPGRRYGPQHAPFADIDELRLLPAVRHDDYQRMRPFVTVWSRSSTINPRTAPLRLLAALPGIDADRLAAFASAREGDPLRTGGLSASLGAIQAYASDGASDAFTISATARLGDGTVFVREAAVTLAPDAPTVFTLESWRQGEDDGTGP